MGRQCGIIVGLYVFISGYGLATKPLSVRMGGAKLYKLWTTFLFVFVSFIPIGLITGVYEFDLIELLKNLFFLASTYNQEWWFFALNVKLIFATCILSHIKKRETSNYYTGNSVCNMCDFAKNELRFITHDLRIYMPIYALSYSVYKLSLFEKIERTTARYIPNIVLRLFIYILLACILGHTITPVRPIQFLFLFLAFSLFQKPGYVSRTLCYLGKHSLNMWLVHTFYCYYYCKKLFVVIADPILAFSLLIALSLATSKDY